MIEMHDAYVNATVWEAYDRVDAAGLCTSPRPLPGWRVDRLYANGEIADYPTAGTRRARCGRRWFVDAVRHDPACECGYRLVRDVYTVLQFAHIQHPTRPVVGMGDGRGLGVGFVLTRAVGTGWFAPRAGDDPPGTVRVAETSLREVWLPRSVGSTLAEVKALARKVRDRYGVSVHVMPGRDLYSFPGSPDTVAPKGWPECGVQRVWHESGNYGLHGAAGAMLSAVIDGERRFLLVERRGGQWQPGRMQLPGGALEAGETPFEAACRETVEELAIPDLGGGSVLGEVVYRHPSGWTYTTFAVDLPAPPEYKVDGSEIARAMWFTEEEIRISARTSEMHPGLAEKLPELLALFE